ncbi:MAG: hypothetical protein LQ348_007641, partial [Seirophora lacunosa]
MPIKWTADKDQKLLLEIVRASNISVDVKKISENWSTSDNETEAAPTPRAIQERIHKIRSLANKGRKTGAGNNNSFKMIGTVGSSSKSSPAAKKASPAKITKARAACASSPPAARRKAAKNGKGRKRRGMEEDSSSSSDDNDKLSDTPSTTTTTTTAPSKEDPNPNPNADDEDPLLSSPPSSASGAKKVKAEAMDGVVEYDIGGG